MEEEPFLENCSHFDIENYFVQAAYRVDENEEILNDHAIENLPLLYKQLQVYYESIPYFKPSQKQILYIATCFAVYLGEMIGINYNRHICWIDGQDYPCMKLKNQIIDLVDEIFKYFQNGNMNDIKEYTENMKKLLRDN